MPNTNVTELREVKLYAITVEVTRAYTMYEEGYTEAEMTRVVGECIADGSLDQYAAHCLPTTYNIKDIRVVTTRSDLDKWEKHDE